MLMQVRGVAAKGVQVRGFAGTGLGMNPKSPVSSSRE